jgi:hypothetical protein
MKRALLVVLLLCLPALADAQTATYGKGLPSGRPFLSPTFDTALIGFPVRNVRSDRWSFGTFRGVL